MSKLPNSRPGGLQDYFGPRLAALENLRAVILRVFAEYGYSPVEPPILERARSFLERSGEAIRQRMYIFNDPGGRELCLRPELTIPVARLYLESAAERSGGQRLCYHGPAFRYERPGRGRYRQFQQAGVELYGMADREMADAEIIGLAYRTMSELGLTPQIRIGDLALFEALIEGLHLPPRWRNRLKRYFWNAVKFQQMLDSLRAKSSADALSGQRRQFVAALSELGEEKALAVVEEILALADIKQVGHRSIEEIANRFIESAADTAAPVSMELIGCIENFLALRGQPAQWLEQIQSFGREVGVEFDPVVQTMQRRLDLMAAYGIPPHAIQAETAFRHGIEYYTGFIFEFHHDDLGQSSQLCGGGRYDRLLGLLGAREDIPAIGFAMGLERLLLAVEAGQASQPAAAVDAVVAPLGEQASRSGVEAAEILRRAGWRVRLDLSGQRPRRIIARAVEDHIPTLLFIGEEELAAQTVRVKDLASQQERSLPIGELAELSRSSQR